MQFSSSLGLLNISPIYIALMGLLFIPIQLRVATYRIRSDIMLGDGGDAELLRRLRGRGNFAETVPMALVQMLALEIVGVSGEWLHCLGILLILGRLSHYIGITQLGPVLCRPAGVVATDSFYFIASVLLLVALL